MTKTTYFDWTVRGLSLAIAGGAVFTIGVAAHAQPGPDAPERGPERFIERADSNGDGNVTLEEMNAMHAKQTAEHFSRMDTNGDGVINGEDPRPEPPGDREFGPHGERPRPEGDFGPRGGDRPRPEGDFGRRGDGPRGEGDFGRRGDGPRGEGDFGRRGGGPRGHGDSGPRGDRPRGDGDFGPRGGGPRPDGDAGPRGKRGGSVFMEKADTDGDGGVSLAELQAVRPDATQEDFNKRDVNGDGILNRDDREDKHASRRGGHDKGADRRGPRGPHGPESMMKADANGDGNVTLEELQTANAEATAMRFSEHDTNGDGVLNQEDVPESGRGGRGHHGPRDGQDN